MGRKGKAECFLLNLFLRPRLPDLRRPALAWWICGSFESIFQLFVVGASISLDSASLFFFFKLGTDCSPSSVRGM